MRGGTSPEVLLRTVVGHCRHKLLYSIQHWPFCTLSEMTVTAGSSRLRPSWVHLSTVSSARRGEERGTSLAWSFFRHAPCWRWRASIKTRSITCTVLYCDATALYGLEPLSTASLYCLLPFHLFISLGLHFPLLVSKTLCLFCLLFPCACTGYYRRPHPLYYTQKYRLINTVHHHEFFMYDTVLRRRSGLFFY